MQSNYSEETITYQDSTQCKINLCSLSTSSINDPQSAQLIKQLVSHKNEQQKVTVQRVPKSQRRYIVFYETSNSYSTPIPLEPSQNCRPWTQTDLHHIVELWCSGYTDREFGNKLNRSPRACKWQMEIIRLHLRHLNDTIFNNKLTFTTLKKIMQWANNADSCIVTQTEACKFDFTIEELLLILKEYEFYFIKGEQCKEFVKE
ncbi:Hypothetical_protein [Hexamita inflata]|uniref:Hypothetical_protein n=1 Tax=Hexamita inflata TaxID=28002 RepID=A0AA86TQD2_9EUKA|nr:Hypothetical protein HINF_LOCUS10487 [Hexamita inflata]